MDKSISIQGRTISQEEIRQIKGLMEQNPGWGRTKFSKELCKEWDWKNDKGQIKDIACRTLLRKLEKRGYINLPAPRHTPLPRMRDQRRTQLQFSFLTEKWSEASTFKDAFPLTIMVVSPGSADGKLFAVLLAEYHYLGYKGSVGEHLAYLIRDNKGNLLGCLLFGAAAWRTGSRDKFIGWGEEPRRRNLRLVANNMRFLLLKQIPHLASHILGAIARRISKDWHEKYGHHIVLLETFVEVGRFAGTCYRAANWTYAGETQGRSRNDVKHKLMVPVKHIYLYPLIKDFRRVLCS